MSINLNLRYQKKDQFSNEIFIASSKYDEELPAYKTLEKLEKKLKEMNLGSFLPVYVNEDIGYSTIRFKFLKSPVKLVERDVYSVTFVVKKSKRETKEYINCFVSSIKLHKKAPARNDGEVLDLGI